MDEQRPIDSTCVLNIATTAVNRDGWIGSDQGSDSGCESFQLAAASLSNKFTNTFFDRTRLKCL